MQNRSPHRACAGVIIADDDPMVRDVLRSKLEAIDQNVFLASDGMEAVALASRVPAALIMLDLNMPRMNGLLACQTIRQLPGHAKTPVLILTSTIGPDAAAAAERAGATEYLTKPFRAAQLLEVLVRFLPISEATRNAIRRSAERAAEIAQALPNAAGNKGSATGAPSAPLDRSRNILAGLR